MNDNVLIVDDEPIIRNGLKNFIDWEKLGFTLAGDCANGLQALELLRSRPIDILITDIKMPVMDGLVLTKHALEVNPQIKIVLISSYNEFEYVREGMKHGAVDYLLKPSLEAEELIAVLLRCKEMLAKNRKQAVERIQFDRQATMLERKRFEQEIIRLLISSQSDFRFIDIFGRQNGSYVCAFVEYDGLNEWREQYGNLHVSMMYEDMQAIFYEQFQKGSAPILAGEGLFLIYPHEESASISLERFKVRVEEELSVSISIGCCTEAETEWVEKGLRRCRAAGGRRFFEGTGRIFSCEAQREDGGSESAQHPHEQEKMDMHAMVETIRAANNNKSVIDSFFSRWKNVRYTPEQVKREAYELLSAFAYINGDSKGLSEFRENIWRCDTIVQLQATIRHLFEEMEHPNRLRLNDKGHGGQLITKAMEYIKLHYREELTLQEVADSIHVSKSYFSNLFKKQSGHNFIDYLIDLRLHEAKRLLVQNECKIYEVAEKSGFNDVKYFSKLFKKMTQMTPVEYREKHQQ
ncbi:response regulator [Paenibacillus prosopidis]|uniref:Two-component system response regulator YesN n=1 Tax=Paenibacillus prosopidis TaxID=630520 RepID=A0A368W3L7_9BACL|nr:response regulator [Paenibacillus prosopidis]RCW48556.1 two-component system response regulator YesN [Paenibacillus prosopidis]